LHGARLPVPKRSSSHHARRSSTLTLLLQRRLLAVQRCPRLWPSGTAPRSGRGAAHDQPPRHSAALLLLSQSADRRSSAVQRRRRALRSRGKTASNTPDSAPLSAATKVGWRQNPQLTAAARRGGSPWRTTQSAPPGGDGRRCPHWRTKVSFRKLVTACTNKDREPYPYPFAIFAI
jgi:hypothetical protein